MAYLTSQTKGGYYPLPIQHIPAITSLFKVICGDGSVQQPRLLDPCAGEGDALQRLASAWGLAAYANELDTERAVACRAKFGDDHTVQGDLMTLRTPNGAYSVVYCNPPYAENTGHAGEKRREFEMLSHSWKWVQNGGLVLWVVYAHHMTERAASFLVKHSSWVDIYRLPGLHLDTYTQILVVAKARPVERTEEASAEILRLVESCKQPDTLPELAPVEQPIYTIPPAQMVKRFYFHPNQVSAEVMLPVLTTTGVQHSNAFRAVIEIPPPPAMLEPIVPPRAGQLGMILAAGLFNGLLLELEDGPAAVRGVVRMVEINTTPDELKGIRETIEHKAQVTISLLHKNGRLTVIESGEHERLVAFVQAHKQAFLDYLQQHSRPLYTFNYSRHTPVFDRVFRNRLLPGRPVTGLFETQKHVVAAMLTTLEKRRRVILAGDMGTGKGPMGATAIAALWADQKFRPGQVAVVMAPPHLVEKWQTELRDAIPGCVPHIADKGPGSGESETLVDDVATFMARAKANPHILHVLVLSRERAKLGEGWQPAYQVQRRHFVRWALGGSIPKEYLDEQGNLLPKASRCGSEDTLICPTCSTPICSSQTGDSKTSPLSWLKTQPRICRECGGALWQLRRTFSAPAPGQISPKRNPRYPIATLLREHYPDRIAVAVCDELHENKSASTDQGRAMQNLVHIADYAIGMTGTLFGGLSSSLFWLEWAFNNTRMVQNYPLDEGIQPAINRWVRSMGVMIKVIEYKKDEQAGTYNGTDRCEHKPEEAPGISPLLIGELISHCIWVGLPDLAFNLPDYEELPIPVTLPPEIQEHYDRQKALLLDYLNACRHEGDASFLGAYLQAMLRYPSTCYQARPVWHRTPRTDSQGQRVTQLVTTLQSFGTKQVYPKEQALLDLLKAELAAKRPCVVFIAQSGHIAIQERLVDLIDQHVPGAKPVVLESNTVATDKRDGWLKKQIAKGSNILVCNPKLIETGIDLLAFKSLIFYEVAYSLYTVSQASRRHWRIGQTDTCRVYHVYYENTMEAQAIELVSNKQAAAALLGGDAIGGGLAQLAGGATSLEAELAKSIAADETVVDASKLFRQTAQASADFTSGWATGAKLDESHTKVVPLENLVGKRFYHEDEAHQVVDYGPLDQAAYRVKNLRSDAARLLNAQAVLAAPSIAENAPLILERTTPARSAPIEAGPRLPQAPELASYHAAKRQYPNALVMVEHADGLWAYGEDAQTICKIISPSRLDARIIQDIRVPFTSLPAQDPDHWIRTLNRNGQQVVLIRRTQAKPAPASASQTDQHSLPTTLKQAYARFREAQQGHVLTFVEMPDQFVSFEGDAITAAQKLFRPSAVTHLPGGPSLKTLVLKRGEHEAAIQRLLRARQPVALANGRIQVLQPQSRPAAAPQRPPQQRQIASQGQLALF